jgi:hypothetical protein
MSLSLYPWETATATHLIGDRADVNSWSTENLFPLLELNTGFSVCSMSLYRLSHPSSSCPYVVKQTLKHSGYQMHHLFRFQKLHFTQRMHLCFVWLSDCFFILRRCQHLLLYSAACQDDWCILNCKGFGRKRLWYKLNIISVSAWKDCGKPSAPAEEVSTYPLKLFCRHILSFLKITFF